MIISLSLPCSRPLQFAIAPSIPALILDWCVLCSHAGAEPPQVKSLLDKLRPLSHGLSVCGAGGGGFVVCITKAPGEEVRSLCICASFQYGIAKVSRSPYIARGTPPVILLEGGNEVLGDMAVLGISVKLCCTLLCRTHR